MKTLKKFKGKFDLSNKNIQAIKGGMPVVDSTSTNGNNGKDEPPKAGGRRQ